MILSFCALSSGSAAASTGKILYESSGGVYVANADGSGATQVPNISSAYDATLSPDGSRVAWDQWDNYNIILHVTNIDGSGTTTVYDPGEWASWSPDGNWIVIGNGNIYKMHPDGSDVTELYSGSALWPVFSRDGSTIAFRGAAGIMAMNADGSDVRTVVPNATGGRIAFGPGNVIAFANQDSTGTWQLYSVNLDGSGEQQLSNFPENAPGQDSPEDVSWSTDGSELAFTYCDGSEVVNGYQECTIGEGVYTIPASGGSPSLLISGGSSPQYPEPYTGSGAQFPLTPTETQGNGNPTETGCTQVCSGDPVDTATGDYAESVTDLAVGGRGPGLSMARTYSSTGAAAGQSSPLGAGWSYTYNMSLAVAASGVATVTNNNGSQTSFLPNGAGGYVGAPKVLATLVHNSGGTWTYTVKARTVYTFTSAGKLSSIADLNGNTVTLAYNSAGQLQTATDPDKRALTFAYDSSGNLASVTDSSGRKVSYTHDSSGNLTGVTDVRGGQWTYSYDANHLLLTRKDANGNVVMTNTYDSGGRTLTQTDALGNKTTYAYNANPSTVTDVTTPNGNVTEYDYTNGLLSSMTKADGTSSAATWNYGYDTAGSLGMTNVIDPNGNSTSATYDAQGNQTSTTDGLGHSTSSSYDSLNDMTSHTDANGVTTTYTYDAKGNLLTRSTPLTGSSQVQTTTYTYGDSTNPGMVTAVKDPNGNTASMTYDAAGDLASETDPLGDKTTYTYDGISRRLTKVSPRGNVKGAKGSQYTTSYTYDAAGDLLTATDPLGHKTTYTYDADGNEITTTDPDGNTTTSAYNAANELMKITRADGTTLQDGYDGDGNLTSQTNGAGNTTSYTYDRLDHLASVTDPLNRTTSYTYDAVGNLLSSVDPEQRTTTYKYDADNRLTNISYSDGTTPAVSYGYDNDGHRTSMSDGSGNSTYAYDSLGRLTQAQDGHGDSTSFGYDLDGNETSIAYPNAKTVTRTFDTADRLTAITDWLGNKTTIAYDPDADATTTTFPSATGNVDTNTYNNADQISAIGMAKGSTTLASLTYTRDNNGQVTNESPTGLPTGSQSYTYNKLNQLTQAGSSGYAYDSADDPTTLSGQAGLTYDKANELTQGPNASYGYNSLGERTSSTPGSGSATTYSYNQAGDLTGVNGAVTASYSYDGNGQRATKTTSGQTTYYTWDQSASLPLLLSDGSTNYIYGPTGAPLEQISTSGTVTYYHHDQLGSTRVLTNATGASVATFSYTSYGGPAGSTGTARTPLGYAGQYTDPETGLIYLQARYYDPATGQFLSRDPMTDVTSEAYAYASDNPTTYTDPTGQIAIAGGGGTPVTVQDILSDPDLLSGLNPDDLLNMLGGTPAGYVVTTLGSGSHAGQGWALRGITEDEQLTGVLIRWHPGGGHHGEDPYWRVSSPGGGKSDEIPGGAWQQGETGGDNGDGNGGSSGDGSGAGTCEVSLGAGCEDNLNNPWDDPQDDDNWWDDISNGTTSCGLELESL